MEPKQRRHTPNRTAAAAATVEASSPGSRKWIPFRIQDIFYKMSEWLTE